ncbi:MAG: DNA/RNA nuclease SfsA [Alphaproteobacteria bacterium]|nr:DNA/RNA nuclease SfsA [Alphaproteobacteria bacterium]
MQFNPPLIPGILIKRYKRFMVDVRLEGGEIITAHCPNTGAMLGLIEEGRRVGLSKSNDPKRKYAHTLEMIEEEGHFVGVNTQNPNKLVHEGLLNGFFPMLRGYDAVHKEVKINKESRLDFALTAVDQPTCYVEVKNVHYKKGTTAYFPDSVTERGQKHLRDLMVLRGEGARCVMLYIIQRDDVENFALADFIDPTYTKLAREAQEHGVEIYAFMARLALNAITLAREIPYARE